MTRFKHLTDKKLKYLLVPVMPTPNGGLHLGHLSGPYLKTDVLARAQRRQGHEAAIFFGSDSYESYMNLKSWQTGRPEEELCNEFHNRMVSDLDALNIEYDLFINPLDAKYNSEFRKFFLSQVQDLFNEGVLELRSEKYLYAEKDDCFLTGCWILGECPVCGSATGSYQCEDCGTQYRPMDLRSPSYRKGESSLSTLGEEDLYLIIKNKERLFCHLDSMEIGEEFVQIAKTYFDKQGPIVRLTNPGTYGLSYPIAKSEIPHVLFTYTSLYFYSLFCGELYKKKFCTELHPFHKNSDVITVASFGIDCSVPYLVAGVGLGQASSAYRPFDFLLPNHFFTLEDSKFSTSRGHAIWGNDFIKNTLVSPDAIRYFLACKNPEYGMTDFNVREFMRFVNKDLADILQPMLTKAWNSIIQPPDNMPTAHSGFIIEDLLYLQNECFTPPAFKLKGGCTLLQNWIAFGNERQFDSNTGYWWLKCYALLSYPIMPSSAIAIWRLLGHSGLPEEERFFELTETQSIEKFPDFFGKITFEDLKPALPDTLTT